MVHYCPHCWAEVPERAERCPACGESLAPGNEDYVAKLIAAVRHVEPTRAALAAQILGEMLAEPRAIEPFIALLDEPRDISVLRPAAEALGRFGDARAVPALRRRALDWSTPLAVRLAAVDALARIGGEEACAALEGALADPNATVREHARQGLGAEESPPNAAGETESMLSQ